MTIHQPLGENRSRTTAAEWIVVSTAFLAVSLYAALGQQVARLSADGTEYHLMAAQYTAGKTVVSAPAPFAFRVATPWLASRLDPIARAVLPDALEVGIEDANGLKGFPGFYTVNIAACLILTLLFHWYVAHFIQSRAVRVLITLVWIAQWNAPVRFTFFYPAYVDPLFMVSLFAGLLVVERAGDRSPGRAMLLASIVTFLGTLCRETAVLIPLVCVARYWRTIVHASSSWHRAVIVAPLLAWIAAIATTRQLATPTGPYETSAFAVAMVREKPLFTWVLAWFFTFGPAALALIASAWPQVKIACASRPHWLVYLLACGVLGYFGSTDTERILIWASPIVLVLAGLALEQLRDNLRRAPLVAILLTVVAIASTRILWHVPSGIEQARPASALRLDLESAYSVLDRLLVIDNYYTNLWSFYGSRSIHAFQLACDIVFVLTVVFFLRMRRSVPH